MNFDEIAKSIVKERLHDIIMNEYLPRAKAIAKEQIKNTPRSHGHASWSKNRLAESIDAKEIDDYTYRIGTNGIHYANIVDEGRGAVHVKYAEYLYEKGNPFFEEYGPRKSVAGTTGADIVKAWKERLKQ